MQLIEEYLFIKRNVVHGPIALDVSMDSQVFEYDISYRSVLGDVTYNIKLGF